MIKRVISEVLIIKNRWIFSRKAKIILKNLQKNSVPILLSKDKLDEHIKYWSRFGSKVESRSYKIFSSVNGREDPLFVPETIYYTQIEPRLNNNMMVLAYADKNIYDMFYSGFDIFPKCYIRKIENVFYDNRYNLFNPSKSTINDIIGEGTRLIVKKTYDTGGGEDVRLYKYTDGLFEDSAGGSINSLDELSKLFGSSFILQEYIEQHDFYKRFNTSSLNTVRVLTYRSVKNNEVIPIQSVLRIGRPGKIVDNQASGGISCGIDNSGILNDFAVDKYGNKYFESNGMGFNTTEKLLLFDEMKKISIQIARKQYYSRLLGFDFCVDLSGKVRLLEINNSNIETNFHQMNNGPLFADYTEEIVEYCLKSSKTICLDFTV